MNAAVSYFKTFAAAPQTVQLIRLLDAIRGDKWQSEAMRARQLYAAWKAVCPTLDSKESPEAQAYDALKKTLPSFCISGTAQDRKTPLEHSNLLQVDCDKLSANGIALDTLREQLKADPHIAFGFVSPSGDGLKCGLRIDGSKHLESFFATERYFQKAYGVRIDPAVKDRLRLCFVSHDPNAWTNDAATPLPIPQTTPQENISTASTAAPEVLVLPSGAVSISESARVIFSRIGPTRTLFWRGGALFELVETEGISGLEILRPEKFCSDVEKLGQLYAWRAAGKGEPALKPSHMNVDVAKRILAASESRQFLPPVTSVLRCPALVETPSGDVAVLGRGYHPEQGGLLITAGETPPQVELSEAVASLRWLLDEFHFQDGGDHSRALASFITPALRLGGHLREHIPFDAAEADESQSGKGYRHEMVCTLYNERAYFITAKSGGVGSVDESFAAALIEARPFICFDNFRGKMNSENLEAFLTCPSLFPARVPRAPEVLVNPKRFMLQLSSNGLETTTDLANRASICRIRKRPGFAYRDTLGELRKRQPYFLGCVFAIVAEWIANGKPRTKDTRHSFTEWNQTLDWIVQNILGAAPLMDGHQSAQQRTSNPALSWLRAVAVAVAGMNRMGEAFTASELVELCELRSVTIPGNPADEDRAKRQIGSLCKQLFRESESVAIDGYTVTRSQKAYRKPSGDLDHTNAYTFTK